ncbi:MAG: hypothetical protein ACRDTG_28485 [Pseudonocardiaceae bacterium]
MTDLDAIRSRLDAVGDIDLTRVSRTRECERYGDWVDIGPVMMMDSDPEDEQPAVRDQARAQRSASEKL